MLPRRANRKSQKVTPFEKNVKKKVEVYPYTINCFEFFFLQVHLEDKDRALVSAFNQEITDVRQMYAEGHIDPPEHCNMPPVVSKLMWVHALKERIRVG